MEKWMWLVAGPNGAGKSSFASKFLVVLGYDDLIRLNADDETKALLLAYPDKPVNDIAKILHLDIPGEIINDINLLAVRKVDADVIKTINSGKSFYIDTVLSTPKYRDDVLYAKELGYNNGLVYVSLYPPEISPARVAVRVERGGHNVDPIKAVERYYRSHNELRWFAAQADVFTIHDNSVDESDPVMIAAKWAGQEIVHYRKGVNPEVDRAVEDIKKLTRSKSASAPNNG